MSTFSVPKIAAAVAVVLLLALGGGFVKLGMNPPQPEQTLVHKDLPASRFASENGVAATSGGALPAASHPEAAAAPPVAPSGSPAAH